MQKQSFTIGNVHCASCEGKIIKLLSALEGVEEVIVNVLHKKMHVTLNTKLTTATDIEKTMQGAGYTASPLWATDTADTSNAAQDNGLQEQAFLLHKAHCSSCQGKIHAALMVIDGIVSAEVNTLRRSVVVRYAPEKILPAGIIQAFQDSKYKLQEVNKNALPPLIPSIQDVKQKKLPTLEKKSPVPTPAEKEDLDADIITHKLALQKK